MSTRQLVAGRHWFVCAGIIQQETENCRRARGNGAPETGIGLRRTEAIINLPTVIACRYLMFA